MITFDGESSTVTITDEIAVDVQGDLYSRWKDWAYDNPEYKNAFRVVGGDTLGGGMIAPAYFFLTNGWRVVIDGCQVVVAYNLYSDDYDSPFVLVNNASVTNKATDVPTLNVQSNETDDALLVEIRDAVSRLPRTTLAADERSALLGMTESVFDAIFHREVGCK